MFPKFAFTTSQYLEKLASITLLRYQRKIRVGVSKTLTSINHQSSAISDYIANEYDNVSAMPVEVRDQVIEITSDRSFDNLFDYEGEREPEQVLESVVPTGSNLPSTGEAQMIANEIRNSFASIAFSARPNSLRWLNLAQSNKST